MIKNFTSFLGYFIDLTIRVLVAVFFASKSKILPLVVPEMLVIAGFAKIIRQFPNSFKLTTHNILLTPKFN